MNDASNSVARLLQSTVTDFFRQAVIDYVLAVNLNVFSEFAERLETSDPGQILRLRKIREEAIETSTSQVLAEGETKVAAWTLLSPTEADVVRSPKNLYQERILLISNKAVYSIEYEYNLQKVSSRLRLAVARTDRPLSPPLGRQLHSHPYWRHCLPPNRRLHPLRSRTLNARRRRELRPPHPLPRPLGDGADPHLHHQVLQTLLRQILLLRHSYRLLLTPSRRLEGPLPRLQSSPKGRRSSQRWAE